MSLKRLTGDRLHRFPADSWNSICDAIERFRGNGPPDELFEIGRFDAITIQVANLHTATLPPLGCIGLGNPLVLPADSEPRFRENQVLKGYQCVASSHRFKTAVLLEELRQNEVGTAAIAGVVPLQISVGHASHLFVTAPASAGNVLESSWWGCGRILWKEAGTGTKWAVVELGDYWSHTLLGKAPSAISKGSSGTVQVWPDSGGSDSGSTVTALARGAAITANKYVQMVWPYNSDTPIVGPFEC